MRDISVRASGIARVIECPGAAQDPMVAIREESDPARLGTACHEALRDLIAYGSVQWDSLDALAARHGVDIEELRMLCAFATKMWPAIKATFAGALTEMGFSVNLSDRTTLTGHVDMVTEASRSGLRIAHVGDWKTGRKDSDYTEQMRAYATLVMVDDPTLDAVEMTVIWIRDSEVVPYTFTRAQSEVWAHDLRQTIEEWDGVYHPGAHCYGCPRSHECSAMNALARRDVAIVLDTDIAQALATMTPDELIALHVRAKEVASRAAAVTKALRDHVENNGTIACGSGTLSLVPEPRREMDTAKAWGVLQAIGFKDADFAEVIDISISRVEKRVATSAGKGKGATAVRALTKELEAAEAITTKTIHKLTLKR